MRLTHTLALVPALLLAGCATRPLPTVKETGDRAFQKGDFQTANVNYAEYVDRKPGEAEVQMMYARTLLALGQPAKAVEHATFAYDQKPGDAAYIDALAQSLYESHRTDDLYRFLKGLTEGRGSVADYLRLGDYSAKLGDPDGAEHAYITAAQLDKGRSLAVQMALANFYTSIKDKNNAVRRLRMALYLDHKNPDVIAALRAAGEIPGPSLALPPAEAE